jgi:transposase
MSQLKVRIQVYTPAESYSEAFKRMVVSEFEKGNTSKNELQRKHNIKGNTRLLTWCRKYGKLDYSTKGCIIESPMTNQSRKRIRELERQLEEEKLKVVAYQKIIEIAEREDGISIIKKDAAKQ